MKKLDGIITEQYPIFLSLSLINDPELQRWLDYWKSLVEFPCPLREIGLVEKENKLEAQMLIASYPTDPKVKIYFNFTSGIKNSEFESTKLYSIGFWLHDKAYPIEHNSVNGWSSDVPALFIIQFVKSQNKEGQPVLFLHMIKENTKEIKVKLTGTYDPRFLLNIPTDLVALFVKAREHFEKLFD